MKIGFFGGCFNPPSCVHIDLAKKIIAEYKLDEVIFVPVGDYYKKEGLVKASHRCNMIKLAIENEPKLKIDTLTLKSKKILYASDTFKLIKQKYNNDELFFIMGSDNFRKMPNWKNYDELMEHYNIIVIERERKHIRKTNKNNVFEYIPEQLQEIDSSKIREMILKNENVEKYLNTSVYEYIKKYKLYSCEEY